MLIEDNMSGSIDDLIKHLNMPSSDFNAYVYLPKVDNPAPIPTSEQELELTREYLGLIDFRINRHKRLIKKIQDNKWKTSVDRGTLNNLACWQLQILESLRKETHQKLSTLVSKRSEFNYKTLGLDETGCSNRLTELHKSNNSEQNANTILKR